MFIEAKKILGLPVAAVDTESRIGEVRQILIEPENGALLGFLVQTGGILSPKKVLSAVDIREWDPNGLVTESIDNLVPPVEIVRIKEVLDKNIILIGMPAKTESGKRLGSVEDLLIDTDTNSVAKYYLKDLLGNSRVLPADKVFRIDKQVIFTDDVGEVGGGAVGAPA